MISVDFLSCTKVVLCHDSNMFMYYNIPAGDSIIQICHDIDMQTTTTTQMVVAIPTNIKLMTPSIVYVKNH